jgi:hypothetical protein
MATAPASYTLRAATLADMPPLVAVHDAAFADDPCIKHLHPRCDPIDAQAWLLANFERDFGAPGRRYFVLEDEGGCVCSSISIYLYFFVFCLDLFRITSFRIPSSGIW